MRRDLQLKLTKLTANKNFLNIIVSSVSYTHLDVYKRQHIYFRLTINYSVNTNYVFSCSTFAPVNYMRHLWGLTNRSLNLTTDIQKWRLLELYTKLLLFVRLGYLRLR